MNGAEISMKERKTGDYMPEVVKKKLALLEKTTDIVEIAKIIGTITDDPFNMQIMWAYREYLDKLGELGASVNPGIDALLATLALLRGDTKKACEIFENMEEGTPTHYFLKFIMPNLPDEEYVETARTLVANGIAPVPNLAITVGHPSVMCGYRDFTSMIKNLEADPKLRVFLTEEVHGKDLGVYLAEMATAEYYYQIGDTYKALVKVLSLIPKLKEHEGVRVLFPALALQMRILGLNGEVEVIQDLINKLREEVEKNGVEEIIANINAYEAWAYMVDGDYARLTEWMRKEAPNEFGEFTVLDIFRYSIKIRGYLIYGKTMAVANLCNKIVPLLEWSHRVKDLCEYEFLWAYCDQDRGDMEEAAVHFEKSFRFAKEYELHRTLADEGIRMCKLIDGYLDYVKAVEKGEKDGSVAGKPSSEEMEYLEKIRNMAAEIAIEFPRYLRPQMADGALLTKGEIAVLKLQADGRKNDEIAEILHISKNTVKFHCKNINVKLCASNRTEAVSTAVQLGILSTKENN